MCARTMALRRRSTSHVARVYALTIQKTPSAIDEIPIAAPAARPRRATTRADMNPAKATPKSDIESRMPAAKTTISPSRTGNGATPIPNGSSVKARRLLTANAAPMSVGRWECAASTG